MKEITLGPDTYLKRAPSCPVCRTRLNGTMSVKPGRCEAGPADPKPGHFTVCAYCTTVLRYEIGLQLREATPSDLRELYDNRPELFALLEKLVVATRQVRTNARRSKAGTN